MINLPNTIKVMKYPSPGDGRIGIYEFICNTQSDVSSLPTNESGVRPGSAALVAATSDIYILNASNQWVKTAPTGGASSADIQRILDGAPENFDTLKEISDWIEEHEEELQDILDSVVASAPDWEQSDPDAPDYIKNRPFYDNGTTVKTYIDTNISRFESEGSQTDFFLLQESDMIEDVEIGDIVTVKVDDVIYDNIEVVDVGSAVSYPEPIIAISDGNVISHDPRPTFMIILSQSFMENQMGAPGYIGYLTGIDGSTESLSLTITSEKKDIKRIDDKFINIYKSNWDETDTESNEYIVNRPFGLVPTTVVYPEKTLVGYKTHDSWFSAFFSINGNFLSYSFDDTYIGVTINNGEEKKYPGSNFKNRFLIYGDGFTLSLIEATDSESLFCVHIHVQDPPDEYTFTISLTVYTYDKTKIPLIYQNQVDWDENDEKSSKYIKNKPGGLLRYEPTLLFSGDFTQEIPVGRVLPFNGDSTIMPKAGDRIKICFGEYDLDDNKYEHELIVDVENGSYLNMAGVSRTELLTDRIEISSSTILQRYVFNNLSNNPDFQSEARQGIYFVTKNGEPCIIIDLLDEIFKSSFAVYYLYPIHNKLDKKAIPQSDWEELDNTLGTYIANKPFGEKIVRKHFIQYIGSVTYHEDPRGYNQDHCYYGTIPYDNYPDLDALITGYVSLRHGEDEIQTFWFIDVPFIRQDNGLCILSSVHNYSSDLFEYMSIWWTEDAKIHMYWDYQNRNSVNQIRETIDNVVIELNADFVVTDKIDSKYLPDILPAVTSSDEGKILTVDSTGEWVADTLPTYNGTVVNNNV